MEEVLLHPLIDISYLATLHEADIPAKNSSETIFTKEN